MSSRAAIADRPPGRPVPPLHAGDRLTNGEFRRRAAMHPEIKKAELIDGLVFVEMTVSRTHAGAHAAATTWLTVYAAGQPGVEALDNQTVVLADGTEVQPDILLRKTAGGSSVVSVDDCIGGPPELAFEVAASSASYDLHAKKEAYRLAGVAEYIVWQLYENRVDWFVLEGGGQYSKQEADATGTISSHVFPGLVLRVAALLGGDLQAVLAPVDQP